MKKWGLALGAGGSRGVAHVGFIKALEEEGLKPDFITGSSMGSVVGACYAAGMKPDRMHEEVKKLKLGQIVQLNIAPLTGDALFKNGKMLRTIKKYVGEKKIKDLEIPFGCVATDLITGNTVFFCDGEDPVAECVTASSTMPSIFSPLKMRGMLLIDGGVKCRVPILQAREMGAEVVVAVDVLGQKMKGERKFNTISVLLRSIDIVDAELTKLKRREDNADLFIEPDMGAMSQYKLQDTERAYKAGYKSGKECVKKIKELIK